MKILFTMINGKPSRNKGGGEKIIYLLAKSLINKNFSCYFLSTEYYFQFSKDFFESHNLTLSKPKFIINKFLKYEIFLKLYYFYPVFVSLFLIKKLRFLQKRKLLKNFEIIHAHEPLSLYLIPKRNEKRILTIHTKGSFIDELQLKYDFISHRVINFLKKIEFKGMKTADNITFPSEYAKKIFLTNYSFFRQYNIEVINNGIEKNTISKNMIFESWVREIKKNYDFLILNVANHVYEKRIDIALQIIQEVKRKGQNPFMINVGEGIQTNRLLAMLKELEILDNVKFLGKIPNEEVNYLMQQCDYFIMTSEKSIFDMVILEALQNRCRIICNKDGGNNEIIIDGYNGYLVENNLIPKYVDLILKFNDKILENTSISSKKYTYERMNNDYIKLYGQYI